MSQSTLGAQDVPERGDGLARLWFGILGPPVIWAIRLGTSYILVPYACWWDLVPLLHLVTATALVGTAFVGTVAWRGWRAVEKGRQVELGGRITRIRFMVLVGMFSSALFFIVMLAEGLATLVLNPCQTAGAPLA